jgi:ppGpp synthetase/RelA/SpoT-type nucleotidyltranferase
MESVRPSPDCIWTRTQIGEFIAVRPRYVRLAETLQLILERIAQRGNPGAIVQTRAKSIPSFAEKIQRKKDKYRDPLLRMTDLCGVRVITQTLSDETMVCRKIEGLFAVDWQNSLDVSQRLKPSEFGYRSIHYIVQLNPGTFPNAEFPIDVPDEVYPDPKTPMKAEIQVRTLLEHAWSDFTHDRMYKGGFEIPPKWRRDLAILAGMLEEVDQSFDRVQSGLQTYMASYGSYLSKEKLMEEIELLQIVHESAPEAPGRKPPMSLHNTLAPDIRRCCATWASRFARSTAGNPRGRNTARARNTWKTPSRRLPTMSMRWLRWPEHGNRWIPKRRGRIIARPLNWIPPTPMR